MTSGTEEYRRISNAAKARRAEGRYAEALELYLWMAEGDRSLDGGWIAIEIAECYEALGRLNEARFWAGKAVEENPNVSDRKEVRERLSPVDVRHLLET